LGNAKIMTPLLRVHADMRGSPALSRPPGLGGRISLWVWGAGPPGPPLNSKPLASPAGPPAADEVPKIPDGPSYT